MKNGRGHFETVGTAEVRMVEAIIILEHQRNTGVARICLGGTRPTTRAVGGLGAL